jgi:plastocyanin
MRRAIRIGLLSLTIGVGVIAGTSQAANHTITVADFSFSPPKTHVQVNDSVIWVWAASFSHTSTSDVGSGKTWGSAIQSTGRYGIKITSADGPGPFPYHCTVHALTMKDTIFVDPPPPCCTGTTGNIDCDVTNGVDISDLSALIDNLYITFTPLCCTKAANVDGSLDGGIDISDLSALIDYLYINFTPPAACQ